MAKLKIKKKGRNAPWTPQDARQRLVQIEDVALGKPDEVRMQDWGNESLTAAERAMELVEVRDDLDPAMRAEAIVRFLDALLSDHERNPDDEFRRKRYIAAVSKFGDEPGFGEEPEFKHHRERVAEME